MKQPIPYRHGDVGSIVPASIPKGAKREKTTAVNGEREFILAYGEVTGHAHRLRSKMLEVFTDTEGRRYFKVEQEATVTHEEHKTLTLPPGTYRVNYEREKDWFSHAVRRVID